MLCRLYPPAPEFYAAETLGTARLYQPIGATARRQGDGRNYLTAETGVRGARTNSSAPDLRTARLLAWSVLAAVATMSATFAEVLRVKERGD